jgi:LacI family transcriptional regulator
MKKRRRRVLVLAGWWWPGMAAGLTRFAHEADWHLHIAMPVTGHSPRGVTCDGVLSFHLKVPALLALARKQAAAHPAVLISGLKPIFAAPVVHEDNVAIGRMAAEHFLARGFREFVWLSNDSHRVSNDRRAGFLAVLQAAGMPCRCLEWPGEEIQWRHYSRWAARHLAKVPRPFALFAKDDAVAIDAIAICKDSGLRVPQDVAVLGVGNDPMLCDFSDVPLSSIDVDWNEIVYQAAAMLDRLMSGERAPLKTLVFPPRQVVTRTSSDIVAAQQPDLAAAWHFIREHYREPITPHQVARAVGVTRRTLENHFRDHLHTAPAAEIRRRRLEHVKDRLSRTELSLAEIARESGFESAVALSKTFKREVGLPPGEYRANHRQAGSASRTDSSKAEGH